MISHLKSRKQAFQKIDTILKQDFKHIRNAPELYSTGTIPVLYNSGAYSEYILELCDVT